MKKFIYTLAAVFICVAGFAQDKEGAKALVKSGMTKIANDDCAGAIKDFEAAVKKDSTNMDAYLKRAFCNSQLGKYEETIADYTKVIALKPEHSFAYLSRGSAKHKLKMYKEAMLDFNRAIELNPDDAQAYSNRGDTKKAMGDDDGACKDWSTSAKKGNSEAKIMLKNNRCK